MSKRLRLLLAVVGLMLAGVGASAQPQFHVGPYLQHVTQTSITIMWETTEPADSRVDYGLSAEYGSHAASPEPAKIHTVTLTGLKPDTHYFYRVTSGGLTSEGATFDTAIPADKPFRFAVYGDSRSSDPTMCRRVCEAIAKGQPRIVINVGDVVTNGSEYDQWKTQFLDPASAFSRTVPLYVAIGNHEQNAHWYYDYVSYPAPENYYAFSYGNSRFVVMDTNQDYAPNSPQYKWLVAELSSKEAQAAAWLFAFFHHPPYSEGWDNPSYDGEPLVRRHLVPLLEKCGVDMVFNGHTHDYERGFMNGVYWIITGGGGASLDHWVRGFEHIAISKYVYHYCELDVTARELTLRAVTPDGQVIDTVTVRRRPVS